MELHVAPRLDPVYIDVDLATQVLLNVIASMGVQDGGEPWAARLLAGCEKP